ncbi:RING/FYVE/PHD zinc finger superfamily protein [Actinidia rufa]|uniref:RING/FYVE/PHD zinc finger superfamily protein n=1 Tax=Actinidia rufa TaxID=165716 RepID=A0A7J0F684_9ERIC|nr:RING/FYVE/PHD zinc finger superfamily protein [Actinidia rufa]GFY94222.1 RING/FYVE/PHD zinc finger superfamily protein [Actinidia rufa]
MVVNGRPMKRMKRRVTADLSDFLTFPSAGEASPSGPFRTSVRAFLSKHATLPPPSSLFPHLLTRQILLRVGDLTVDGPDASPAVVCLDIVEEDVARSRSVYCDQCRVVGWSGNPVCTKRYHFIIKADGGSIGGYNKSCASCGEVIHLSESRCKSCNHAMTTEDVEDWIYHQLEDTTHLLHGIVHTNGFGHLLRVNGREGGSKVLSGCRIMDFWDRLCKLLGVRKVSLLDVSKKYGLEYRLLYAITKGHPWYGDWGYEFGAGSFALTLDAYKTAVETLSKQPLSNYLSQGRKPRTRLQDLISFYQSLSERKLVNIKDLFCFLMSLIDDAHKSSSSVNGVPCKKLRLCTSSALCAWTTGDVERVEEAMFRVLRAVSGPNWVSWRALRGAVCKVAPPELLDYCLKELKGKQTVNGMVVNARCLPDTGAIEYRLEHDSVSVSGDTTSTNSAVTNHPSEEHLLRDLRYLYGSMLHPQTMVLNNAPQGSRDLAIISATKLLDCKQFVKDYHPENKLRAENPLAIHLSCEAEVVLAEQSEDAAASPPPELIVLPPNATISDLKHEASKAYQEVYLIFRRFQAEELLGYGGVDESTQVKLLLGGSTESVRVRGICLGKNGMMMSRFRMERGVEPWTVDCTCGAKDDDGERMLACDVCGVWQHTRCAGIPDLDAVPSRFVCYRCRGSAQATETIGLRNEETVGSAVVGGGGSSFERV